MEGNLPYWSSYLVHVGKTVASSASGDISMLILGAILILVAIFLIFIVKRILENAIIGTIGFLILKFVVGVEVPLVPGLIISLLFGLGGLGVLLILHFFGVL